MRDIGTTEEFRGEGDVVLKAAIEGSEDDDGGLTQKNDEQNEGEGTVAKVRESQSAMKNVEEMSTDANASRRSLPVAQIIEQNAEEDLANLFAPMAPKSKKTKAKKKFLSSSLGGKVSLAMEEQEAKRGIAATTSSSSKKSSAQMQSQTKKSEYQAFVDYYSMEYQEYEQMPDKAFEKLRRNLSLEQKHRPMLTYMVSLGFKEKDLEKLMLQSEEQLFSNQSRR